LTIYPDSQKANQPVPGYSPLPPPARQATVDINQ
jgi:hypothetical protein